jgi:hypothetical protein
MWAREKASRSTSTAFNGGAWRDRKVTPAEATLFQILVVNGGDGMPKILNGLGQTIDVDPADLVDGDNTVEFATEHAPGGFPPGVANVDLVLHTE